MSAEQIRLTDKIVAWVTKSIIVLSCGLIVAIFNDMKEDVKIMKADVTNVRERVARIEGAIGNILK